MIEKNHYLEIASKYGYYASWAIWAEEGDRPKSNMGDIRIFDLDYNPDILKQINPNVVMVGLNFSRPVDKKSFINFHDSRPQAQDYKIRYAFKNTKYYGAYMTDIIKDFTHNKSHQVSSYLNENRNFEKKNISLFQEEMDDLKSLNPLIIAFGNDVFKILNRYFKNKYRIVKVPHYSIYISKEDYKIEVGKALRKFREDYPLVKDKITNDINVVGEIKKLQRIYKIKPSNEAINTLIETGIKSAYDIIQMGENKFINKYANTYGKILAREIYLEATRLYNQRTPK